MPLINNQDIQSLIIEEKHVTMNLDFSSMKEKKGHKEAEILIPRADGSSFKIILRQNSKDPLDFSAILAYVPIGKNQDFKLRRYNGKNHQHTNRLDKKKFYDFHIHTATEEYQRAGLKEESFAEQTSRYASLAEAFECLVQDCNVVLPKNRQMRFF